MSDGRKPVGRVASRLIGLVFAAAPGAVWAAEPASTAAVEPSVDPPPRGKPYVQFGVAFTVEGVLSPGPICSGGPADPCILGSGGGISARVGWRPTENVYLGGAYEFSKQDASELYQLAILQQLRAEARRYFPTGRTTSPFLLLGLGAQGYGNEWAVDTWGPNATLGGGVEIDLGGPVLALTLAYRPMYFQAWVDTSTIAHGSGVAHFISFEVSLEARDAL